MTDTFDKALAVILRHEGGFVNHPADPGGMTNLGVTKRTWEDWTGKKAIEADMRGLTPAKVGPLYAERYWNVNHCADMPYGVALCVFDFGVNAGPARAARYLQRVVGTAQDGKIGPATLAALRAMDPADVVKRYSEARRAYYRQLPTFKTFGRGWLRRVNETETEALA